MQTCKTCGKSNDDVDFYASIKTYCKEHWKDKVKANRAANSDYYKAFDPMRGKPCRSGQGQERGRQSRPGGLDWF